MSVFVLADRAQAELSSPIFSAGRKNAEESAAVFTRKLDAEKYIQDADWSETDVVAELDSEALVQWVVNLRRDGVEYLAVNPDRREQDAGRQQSVLSIRDLIAHMSDALCIQLQAPAQAPVEDLVRIDIYTCQSCGRLVRQRPEDSVPQCCNRDMEFAAPDSAAV